MNVDTRPNLLDFDREALRAFLVEHGEAPYRAGQIMRWIYHRLETDFAAMTDLGKALREKLAGIARIEVPRVLHEQASRDGTRKWLLGMHAGNAIEAVYIPEPSRGTLCVSSQVGCALACRFCSTGAQGFNRNLSAAEIIGQVWLVAKQLGNVPHQQRRITNVVMMGMGEPLMNFENVVTAMSLMRDDLGFGLASKRVTLSTAGMVPMIDKLSERSDVSLAVSLHAPTDELRTQLMPINKRFPIAELLAACRRYTERKPRTTVTFEYTMLRGVNDQPEHARGLVRLLRALPAKVNLIPFNPFPGAPYVCSEPEVIERFHKTLNDAGIVAMVRRTRGDDIDAACGQLKGKVVDRTKRSAQFQARVEEAAIDVA